MADTFDLVVIGAGPGGYVAAIRAAQLGMKVACVEKEKALGGTCLRVGCIPSKALLEASERFHQVQHGLERFGVKVKGADLDLAAMMKHKDDVVKANTTGVDGLFAKNKVKRFLGTGRIAAPNRVVVKAADGKEETIETKRILIATGSVPSTIPGVELDGEVVGTSTEALDYPAVPKTLVVIGGGVIGLELGSVWARLGAKVIVIEYLPRILNGMDDEIAATAQKIFTSQGLEFRLGCKVKEAKKAGSGARVVYEDADGKQQVLEADRVLVAVGRKSFTEGLGLEAVGVKVDRRGVVEVDAHFQTSVPGIYAIGDVAPGAMLAHKASEEGVAAVERMAGQAGHVNYDAIPNVVYTEPEIASVGRTEDELKKAGVPYRRGSFPFKYSGRARALNSTEGFVKVLAHEKTDRILGVHIVGPRAGDIIAEAAMMMDMQASAEDLARGCHAHPTLAEALKEAALGVD
ncbi:MAG: dihydrolipoyl dehydrogenase, partial [Myxococcales bacterium]